MFVSFNDPIKAGQPIAQLDQEIFAAHVNEAKAALSVARATAQVQKAALERARVAVVNAQTAKRLAEAQSAAATAKHAEPVASSDGTFLSEARATAHIVIGACR